MPEKKEEQCKPAVITENSWAIVREAQNELGLELFRTRRLVVRLLAAWLTTDSRVAGEYHRILIDEKKTMVSLLKRHLVILGGIPNAPKSVMRDKRADLRTANESLRKLLRLKGKAVAPALKSALNREMGEEILTLATHFVDSWWPHVSGNFGIDESKLHRGLMADLL